MAIPGCIDALFNRSPGLPDWLAVGSWLFETMFYFLVRKTFLDNTSPGKTEMETKETSFPSFRCLSSSCTQAAPLSHAMLPLARRRLSHPRSFPSAAP
jgi:hypothetical protein